MKKILNSKLFYFVLGAVMFSGITVYAVTYLSSDVTFTPTNSEWNVDNVSDALNDLYNKQSENGSGIIGAYGSWKKNTGWNDDGMEVSIINPDEYFTYDGTARTVTSKYTGKISVKFVIFNTSGQSGYPYSGLYKNGTSVITYQGVKTTSVASVSEEYIIDVAEGDVLVSYMYGGGSYAYFLTQFEIIK